MSKKYYAAGGGIGQGEVLCPDGGLLAHFTKKIVGVVKRMLELDRESAKLLRPIGARDIGYSFFYRRESFFENSATSMVEPRLWQGDCGGAFLDGVYNMPGALKRGFIEGAASCRLAMGGIGVRLDGFLNPGPHDKERAFHIAKAEQAGNLTNSLLP